MMPIGRVCNAAMRRFWLPLGVGAFSLALLAWLIFLRTVAPITPLEPDGYDELIAAAGTIQGRWPHEGDWTRADPAELRLFVARNDPTLRRLQSALEHGGSVRFADSQAGLTDLMNRQAQARTVSRLLFAAARVAHEEGRFADQARLDLEILALGQMMTQGSIGVSAQMGWVVQSQAIGQLRQLHDHLDTFDLRSCLTQLEALDRRRTSLEAIDQRWARWYSGAFSLWQRLMMRANGMEAQGRAADQKLVKTAHDRVERAMRFLLVEWAIHEFHHESGRWPRAVAELSPSILTRVPTNPDTHQTLSYPANPAGELTDDLAGIGEPDGAVTPANGPR